MRILSLCGQRFTGEYSDAYLPFMKRTLTLHRHGKSWDVMCHLQVPSGQCKYQKLCKGWKRFARDNNLRVGDLCLFELLETKKYTMTVHVVREFVETET